VQLLLLLASEGAGEGVEGGVAVVAVSSSSRPRMLWMEKDFLLQGSGDKDEVGVVAAAEEEAGMELGEGSGW
jgi:hypothetical protein